MSINFYKVYPATKSCYKKIKTLIYFRIQVSGIDFINPISIAKNDSTHEYVNVKSQVQIIPIFQHYVSQTATIDAFL